MTIRLLCVGLWFAALCNGALAQVFTYDCLALGGTNCTARILDGPQNAITSTIPVPAGAVNACGTSGGTLGVQLNIIHNWIGDLQVSVTNPNSVTAALLSNLASPGGSVGGCQSDDVNAVFQDGAAAASCGFTIPAVSGTVAPAAALLPLALANGAPPGTWTLTLADTANSNDGALNDWAVQISCNAVAQPSQAPLPTPATSHLTLLWTSLLLAAIAGFALRRRSKTR